MSSLSMKPEMPTSIVTNGKTEKWSKSAWRSWFHHNSTVQFINADGTAAIMNMLQPNAAKAFSDYAKQVLSPYIMSQLQHVSRVNVTWDE